MRAYLKTRTPEGLQNLPAFNRPTQGEEFVMNVEGFGGMDTEGGRAFARSQREAVDASMAKMESGEINSAQELLDDLATARQKIAASQGDNNAAAFGNRRSTTDGPDVRYGTTTGKRYSGYQDRIEEITTDGEFVMKGQIGGEDVELTSVSNYAGGRGPLDKWWHTPGENVPKILEHVDGLYKRAMNPALSEKETLELVAEMHWWLAHAMPYERGSAAITDGFTKAVLETRGIQVFRWRQGVLPDLEAFVTPLETFKKQYAELFDAAPVTRAGAPIGADVAGTAAQKADDVDLQGFLDGAAARLQAHADIAPGEIDDWIAKHGLAQASEMVGDRLLTSAGLDLNTALKAMRENPRAFYDTHGALMCAAVLRRATALRQANKALMTSLEGLPGANLLELADGMGFSMLTHYTPGGRSGDIIGSGHLLPGNNSNNYLWGVTGNHQRPPTRMQSYSFADYGRKAQHPLPMAIPAEMLVPPTHAIEIEGLPEALNKWLHLKVKGPYQSAFGNAVGAPPMAVHGPIKLLPDEIGFSPGEVNALRDKIAGTINTKGGETAKLVLAVVLLAGNGIYIANVLLPRMGVGQDNEQSGAPDE